VLQIDEDDLRRGQGVWGEGL